MKYKKSIALVVVLGIMIIISLLAFAIVNLMVGESHVTEHNIRRKRVQLAAQAGMVHAYERLRQEGFTEDQRNYSITVGEDPNDVSVAIQVIPKGEAGCLNAPSDYCINVNPSYD